MDFTDADLIRGMDVLGLVPEDFLCVKQAVSFGEAAENLRALKGKARRGFRRAAKRLHPDVNGGDEGKTELFTRAADLLDQVNRLRVREKPKAVDVDEFLGWLLRLNGQLEGYKIRVNVWRN